MIDGKPDSRKRFRAYMLLILSVAALLWASLRLYNTAQDHERGPESASQSNR